MSENFPLFDPRVNLALMSFTRFEASHDVTIFTINSRYAINTRTWINRSVFALASPCGIPQPRPWESISNQYPRIVRLYYVDEAVCSKYPPRWGRKNFRIFRSIYRFTI